MSSKLFIVNIFLLVGFSNTILHHQLQAQNLLLNGHIIDNNGHPLDSVNIKLMDRVAHAYTNQNGDFQLNIPITDTISLFFSHKDYKDTIIRLYAANKLTLQLLHKQKKDLELPEVIVTSSKITESLFAYFKDIIIGDSTIQKDCKILNPQHIKFIRDSSNVGKFYTTQPIIVDNNILGYINTFILDTLTIYNQKEYNYTSKIFFSEKVGSKQEIREWKKARRKVYEYSKLKFLRLAYQKKFNHRDFGVYRSKIGYIKMSKGYQKVYSNYGGDRLYDSIVVQSRNHIYLSPRLSIAVHNKRNGKNLGYLSTNGNLIELFEDGHVNPENKLQVEFDWNVGQKVWNQLPLDYQEN